MRRKPRAPVSMLLGAALIASAGCAGPRFGTPAGEAGAPAGVHSAGRHATGDAGARDDAGAANGGENGALGPSNGARDAGAHDDGGVLGETSDGTGGTSAGRPAQPTAGAATGTSGSSAGSSAGAGGAGGTTEPRGGGVATAGNGATAPSGNGGVPTAGSAGTAAAGSGGTAAAGEAGTAAGGAPPTCAPTECPLLPPTDGATCTSCELPESGCTYDACLLLDRTYSARCVAAAWSVAVEPCVATSDCCSNESDADCKKHGKGKDCNDD